MPDRIPTGVDPLDRQLGGGLAPGSVLVYEAPPASQAEVLLHSLAESRPTTYVSTIRAPARVEATLAPPATVTGIDPDAPGCGLREVLQSRSSAVVIIDPIDPLEATPAYQSVLSTIESHLVGADTLIVLHALRQPQPPTGRSRTHHVADTVFRLRQSDDRGATTQLSVPKVRDGTPPAEALTLSLTDTVAVDTSRQIA